MNGTIRKAYGPTENVDKYEREKVETTIAQLEHIADCFKIYLLVADILAKKDIDTPIHKRPKDMGDLGDLRHPEVGLAGHRADSDVKKLEVRAEIASRWVQEIAEQNGILYEIQLEAVQKQFQDQIQKLLTHDMTHDSYFRKMKESLLKKLAATLDK